MPRPLLCCLLLSAALAAGCGTEPPAAANNPPANNATAQPNAFDKDACGTVTGYVSWNAPQLPDVALVAAPVPRADGTGIDSRMVPLGYAPRIDRAHRGLAGAVVYLRGIDVGRVRPWNPHKVEVEFRDSQIVIKQDERVGRTGFVKCGDSFTVVSREPVFHTLRARGAAYLALPFPDPDKPLTRTLDKCGRVELTSASGSFWQAADLFVCDHPYYTVTDANGKFHFAQVPEGPCEVVVWHPNWEIERTERNPETGLPNRLIYAAPFEAARPVLVGRGQTALANLTLPK